MVAENRIQRVRTPLDTILLMVLWILATPDSFRSVALRFGVRPGTVHYHCKLIIEVLRDMAPRYISWPTEEERDEIKQNFEAVCGFPGIVGVVDGTHVNVTAPLVQPARYTNRHHMFSFNTQAICDHRLLIRDLYVGEPGSVHDCRVFRRSPFCTEVLQDVNMRLIRPDEHILGDGGYMLTEFLMIPFRNNGHLTEDQQNYNRSLSRGRVRIEMAFGRAKMKWRRLKFLHSMTIGYAVNHITACFVLHNFIILAGEDVDFAERYYNDAVDEEEIPPEEDVDFPEIQVEPDHVLLEPARVRGHEKRLAIVDHLHHRMAR